MLVELGEKVEASTYVYKAGAGKTYSRPGSAQAHTQGEVEAVGVDMGLRESVQLKGGFVWWGEKGRNIEDSRVLVHVPGAYRRVLGLVTHRVLTIMCVLISPQDTLYSRTCLC